MTRVIAATVAIFVLPPVLNWVRLRKLYCSNDKEFFTMVVGLTIVELGILQPWSW